MQGRFQFVVKAKETLSPTHSQAMNVTPHSVWEVYFRGHESEMDMHAQKWTRLVIFKKLSISDDTSKHIS
jgi:hypothetical protein